jgi:hypothetical protein
MVELCVQGWRPGDPGGCWFQPWVLISKGRRKSPAQGEREEIAILLPVLFLTGTPTDCWHHPHGGWVFPLSPPASSQANLLWKQLFWLPKKKYDLPVFQVFLNPVGRPLKSTITLDNIHQFSLL